ncbi:MAG TPA: thermonuclease family protein [Candidatus Omnitrophota bacterium]|nr:thermonuclease family protein [Candidatus Omnitrophota bacterium]
MVFEIFRKDFPWRRAVQGAICLFFLSAGLLFAEKVRYVIDGDTFILTDQQRVRMIGIDAPEVSHPRYGKSGEPFGEESRKYLKALIEGKDVRLEGGEEPFDRFGRRLAYVYLSDGTFVNRQMIEQGYAEVFRKFPFEYKKDFFESERRAKAGKLGMWGDAPESFWTKIRNFCGK